MAHSCDACSSFLLCSCLMVDMLTKLGRLTWPMVGQSVSILAAHPYEIPVIMVCVRPILRREALLELGASRCSARESLHSPIMRNGIRFSIILLTSSCALYAIDDRQDLWRIDQIRATVRPSRQMETEASLGVESCSALSIDSQWSSGRSIVYVS